MRKTLPLQSEIRVYPNLAAERKKSPAFFKRGRLGVHGQRQIGKGREFEKLREYAAGDGFDDIDWKATARRGHPITRVFQIERTQEVYIILDASRLSARPVAGDPDATILERNVTASLLLALAAEKQGDLFGLITFSDRVHDFVRARNGKTHYGACRDALYTLQPRLVAPDFDELFSLLRLRLRRRALLIFLTELDDPIVAEAFQRNVPLLRQHLILVGMAKPIGCAAVVRATRPVVVAGRRLSRAGRPSAVEQAAEAGQRAVEPGRPILAARCRYARPPTRVPLRRLETAAASMIIDLTRFLAEERKHWTQLEATLDRVERNPDQRMKLG